MLFFLESLRLHCLSLFAIRVFSRILRSSIFFVSFYNENLHEMNCMQAYTHSSVAIGMNESVRDRIQNKMGSAVSSIPVVFTMKPLHF